MLLHVLSDLHLEFAPFPPPAVAADAIVLAGDIHTGLQGLRWALETYPRQPVVYVLGNHEFYGQTLQKLTAELHALAAGTNVHVLENESCVVGDVQFLGATLWTDFALQGEPMMAELRAQAGMNDYRRIRTLPNYSRLRPAHTRQFHAASRQWLATQLPASPGRKVVVVTHHAPCPQSIPPIYAGDPLNAAFVSDLTTFVAASQARLWVHGHIHVACDYRLGETRVLANPRGYPGEPATGFDPGLVVDL